jgi:hypothetical protein
VLWFGRRFGIKKLKNKRSLFCSLAMANFEKSIGEFFSLNALLLIDIPKRHPKSV